MILPDTNLLVYAFREDCEEHAVAQRWLTESLSGPAPLALTSAAIAGFVRVVTHRRVFRPPSAIEDAIAFAEAVWRAPASQPTEPGPAYPEVFSELCRMTRATGNDVPDVHLAAVAIEAGAELASHDRAFARFPGLRFSDPLG